MRFGDTCGAECNAGHVFGRAAAYLVIDQRGKPLVVGVRNVSVSLMRYRSSLPLAGSVVGSRHRRSRSRTCDRHSTGKAGRVTAPLPDRFRPPLRPQALPFRGVRGRGHGGNICSQRVFRILTQHGHTGTFHMIAVSSDTARRNPSAR